MEKWRAMYLGRFQIFHSGHLQVAKFIDAEPDVENIVIVIGSSQYSRFVKHPELPWVLNPFTIEERIKMLEMSLEGLLKKPYEIIGVKDTHVCELWYQLVMKEAQPEVFYTNEPKEINLFEKHEMATRAFPPQTVGFHGQVVREMIWHGGNYRKYVPLGTDRFMKEFKIEKMLDDFYRQHMDEIEVVHEMQRKSGIASYDPAHPY